MLDFEDKPIINFDNVGLRYGQGPEVLHDIKFSLPYGSFYFLTGHSGAGKSSLLNMINLSLSPTRGKVKVFSKDINKANRNQLFMLRRQIGVVFQDFRLLNHLSTFDNVALPLRVCGMGEQEIRRRVIELLHWVGLEKRMNAKPLSLSGGEQQRVAIARAVINRPDLLLADEPTGNVDSEIEDKLMKLFTGLNKRGTTVIIATHSERLIRDYNYPRLHLDAGKLRVLIPLQNGITTNLMNNGRY